MGTFVQIGKLISFILMLMAMLILNDPLDIGSKAPATDQEVEDTSGRTWTLNEAAEANGLLVMFSCNTCPWVAKWEDRYNRLSTIADANDIGMIVLNPNERIRNRGESMEDMRLRAQKQDYNFTYALDRDHIIADAFGATRTPEVFLFDDNMTLVYHGAIDDNANDSNEVEANYVEDAMNALLSGAEITQKETRSLGCTIKRTE